MNKNKILLVGLIILFLSSCSQGSSTISGASSTEDQIATSVAETLTVQADQTTSEIPEPDENCLPLHPGIQQLPQPVGFMTGLQSSLIRFYDDSGKILGEKQTPGIYSPRPRWVHAAGGITNGIEGVPLLYNTRDASDLIKANIGSNIFQMDAAVELVALTGAEGKFTLVVLSTVEYAEGKVTSTLKIAEMGELVPTEPQLTRVGDDQLVYYPLGVQIEDGQNQGVWFTYLKHRQSDFIYMPYYGLYFYDLVENSVTEYLSTDTWVKGFSPNHALVAVSPRPGGNSAFQEIGLTVKDWVNCAEWVIPFHEDSILGGGEVVFSPDGKYLAWIETSGFGYDDMQQRLRILDLENPVTFLVDAPVSDLSGLAGGETITYLIPAGWLDKHVLLLSARVQGVDNPLIIAYAPDPAKPLDPALGANQSAPLGEGTFSGFLYP